jgi:hypothetical protein
MALKGILRLIEGGRVGFFCPGCKEMHILKVEADGRRPCWTFNGDFDRPTFAPSVLVTGVKGVNDENGEWTGEWELDADGKAIPSVCHSFVTNGQIQFLNDCTHDLVGQTVQLTAPPHHGD